MSIDQLQHQIFQLKVQINRLRNLRGRLLEKYDESKMIRLIMAEDLMWKGITQDKVKKELQVVEDSVLQQQNHLIEQVKKIDASIDNLMRQCGEITYKIDLLKMEVRHDAIN